jgi:hypothetical protein
MKIILALLAAVAFGMCTTASAYRAHNHVRYIYNPGYYYYPRAYINYDDYPYNYPYNYPYYYQRYPYYNYYQPYPYYRSEPGFGLTFRIR